MPFHEIVETDATVHDTLELLIATVNEYSKSDFVKNVADKLKPWQPEMEFLHRLFDFVCRNITYVLDSRVNYKGEHIEDIWTPAKILDEGKGDCKKFSIFIASVLKAAGYNPVLKWVEYSYEAGTPVEEQWTHIYVVLFINSQEYIVLDPTHKCEFNKEVKYNRGTLYYLNGMSEKIGMELHMMGKPTLNNEMLVDSMDRFTGDCKFLGDSMMGFSFKHKFHFPSLHEVAHALGHVADQVVAVAKKVEHVFAGVSMAIPRAAYLEALRLNIAGMAGHALHAWNKDQGKMEKFWYDFGGDKNAFKAAILQGANKHPLLGQKLGRPIGNIGIAPLAILGAAAPILTGAAMVIHAIDPNSPAAGAVMQASNMAGEAATQPNFDPTKILQAGGLIPDNGAGTMEVMPPGSQFAPPGGGGGTSSGAVGLAAYIAGQDKLCKLFPVHPILSIAGLIVLTAIAISYYDKYYPFIFKLKRYARIFRNW